jgi:zinc transporter 9
MDGLYQALILAAAALVTALIAGGIPIMRGAKDEGRQKMMTGIAAGVLLASALLVAIPEGFDTIASSGTDADSALAVGGAILAGFILMLVLEALGFGHDIHEEHHDHEGEHGHDHVHHPSNPSSVIFGLSIHALTDGLAMGAALATGELSIAIAVTVGVIAHKIPAAFSLGVFSMHERGDASKSWKDLILFSLATPVMIILAYYAFGDVSEYTIGLAMLFAGGTFLYVATVDVLPDVHHIETGKKALVHVLIGVVLMVFLLLLLDMSSIASHDHSAHIH